MKNFFRSKGFLFTMMTAACIGILAVCLLVTREQENDFQPEELSANADTQEKPSALPPAADTVKRTNMGTPAPAATKGPMEEYPMIVDESGDEIVIDFTPASEVLKKETPEPPVAKGDVTDPSVHPTYAPEETEPEPSAPPAQDDTPAPGSSNGNGAVYDPVFGWVVPGQVEQSPADSSGDPGKMVGDM